MNMYVIIFLRFLNMYCNDKCDIQINDNFRYKQKYYWKYLLLDNLNNNVYIIWKKVNVLE